LQTHPQNPVIGASFLELQSIESTNNYALQRIHAGLAYHGDCFFAHEQTRGKGQRGKDWKSEKSSNIILSIVLKPDFLNTYQQFHLSACLAVATERFFYDQAGEPTRIKWPNDIYWKNRKAGGILIENIIGSGQPEPGDQGAKWQWAVAGIGLNINQEIFNAEIPNPISLTQITGKKYNVIELAKKLCSYVDEYYKRLEKNQFDELLQVYNDRLYKKNQTVKLKSDNKVFHAEIKGVDSSGELITVHGVEERFKFGEIDWLKN